MNAGSCGLLDGLAAVRDAIGIPHALAADDEIRSRILAGRAVIADIAMGRILADPASAARQAAWLRGRLAAYPAKGRYRPYEPPAGGAR